MNETKVSTYFKNGLFIRGPLPVNWFKKANQVGVTTKAVVVGLAIWRKFGMERSRTVTLGAKDLRRFGLERHAFYRGLRKLEQAQLVTLERRRGALIKITIINEDSTDEQL